MGTAAELMQRIMSMKFPWNAWVVLLGIVNMAGGIIYFSTLEGKLALVALLLSFAVMVAVFAKHGFVRLLGLGHIVGWVPLVILFVLRLGQGAGGLFKAWLITVIFLNTLSLMLDITDVARYLRGNTSEMP